MTAAFCFDVSARGSSSNSSSSSRSKSRSTCSRTRPWTRRVACASLEFRSSSVAVKTRCSHAVLPLWTVAVRISGSCRARAQQQTCGSVWANEQLSTTSGHIPEPLLERGLHACDEASMADVFSGLGFALHPLCGRFEPVFRVCSHTRSQG